MLRSSGCRAPLDPEIRPGERHHLAV